MDINTRNVRNIYVDTRYKRNAYGSNTEFEIDSPKKVECPEDTVMIVDDILLPNTITTIQQGVRDKSFSPWNIMEAGFYRNETLPKQNYKLASFAKKSQIIYEFCNTCWNTWIYY